MNFGESSPSTGPGIPGRHQQATELEPNIPARNRKLLRRLVAPWRSTAPVWELRVGEYRVFYDIDDEEPVVLVRAIRRKPQRKRTEDIL